MWRVNVLHSLRSFPFYKTLDALVGEGPTSGTAGIWGISESSRTPGLTSGLHG